MTLEAVIRSRLTDRFSMFCGAGVSVDSGLPLASALRSRLVAALPLRRSEAAHAQQAPIPFEAVMECFAIHSDISQILEIFTLGTPNPNHHIIASLARAGLLKTIFTTNFDRLIECALIEQGWREDKDFKVYYTEDHFRKLKPSDLDRDVCILKLHGSVANPDSIRATIRTVASRHLVTQRAALLDYLVSWGSHRSVLFVGYSCSDAFDISPYLLRIAPGSKPVILVEHTPRPGYAVETLHKKGTAHPLHAFHGEFVRCNAALFMRSLLKAFLGTITRPNHEPGPTHWESLVSTWKTQLGDRHEQVTSLVASALMESASAIRPAVRLLEVAGTAALQQQDLAVLQSIYSRRADLLQQMSRRKEALVWAWRAIRAAGRLGDRTAIAGAYRPLGSIYYRQGLYAQARRYYERSLVLSRVLGDRRSVASASTNLGYVYSAMGDSRAALKLFRTSLRIHRNLGNKRLEANSLIGSAGCYIRLGAHRAARRHFEKALAIGIALGDDSLQASAHNGLGTAWLDAGDARAALNHWQKAMELEVQAGRSWPIAGLHMNMACALRQLGDLAESVSEYKMALRLKVRSGDLSGEAECRVGIADVYLARNELAMATRQYTLGLVLARRAKNPRAEMSAHEGVAKLQAVSGRNDRARVACRRALRIAVRIEDRAAIKRCRSYAQQLGSPSLCRVNSR